jgi:hypothetical protein
MANTVVSLSAFVAALDIYVELAGTAVNISLEFGPFDNKEAAESWVDEIQARHALRNLSEVVIAEEIYTSEGLPTRPYIDVHLGTPIIMQSPLVRQRKDLLLPPGNAADVEPQLGAYALRAAFQRLGYACYLLDTQKE